MILRKILTTNTQLILGCAKREKLEFSFENEMFLESLSMNIPVSNMIILRSIKFGLHQYVNGLDDAVFYYPLLEHTGGTQKNESRKIGMAVNSCTLGVIELEYTGFCPPGMLMGCVFQFVASIETLNTHPDTANCKIPYPHSCNSNSTCVICGLTRKQHTTVKNLPHNFEPE